MRRTAGVIVITFLVLLMPRVFAERDVAYTYRLIVANKVGHPQEPLAGMLKRRFATTEIQFLRERERYRKYTYFPMPVCENISFYLLSPADELLAIGCLDNASMSEGVRRIELSQARFEREIRRGERVTILGARSH
ncbi:MAG: hypothetical protein JSR44_05090 [Spirochaetes bacterium]|nr:hypothetical protein [Spirochaetota bacterium]